MEYVDGVHLDTYCDQHKLPIDARIELFLHVCDAVGYAHRNLVCASGPEALEHSGGAGRNGEALDFGTSKLISPTACSRLR